jgi:hypothetical protein
VSRDAADSLALQQPDVFAKHATDVKCERGVEF